MAKKLDKINFKVQDTVLEKVIEDYTRESGVRDLSRKLASIMRNVAKEYTIGTAKRFTIKAKEVEKILGARRFDKDIYSEKNPAGVAVGLALGVAVAVFVRIGVGVGFTVGVGVGVTVGLGVGFADEVAIGA